MIKIDPAQDERSTLLRLYAFVRFIADYSSVCFCIKPNEYFVHAVINGTDFRANTL